MSKVHQAFVSYKGKIPDTATLAPFDDEYAANASSKFSPFNGQAVKPSSESSTTIVASDFNDLATVGTCPKCSSIHRADVITAQAMIDQDCAAFHCIDCASVVPLAVNSKELIAIVARLDKADAADGDGLTAPGDDSQQPDATKVDIVAKDNVNNDADGGVLNSGVNGNGDQPVPEPEDANVEADAKAMTASYLAGKTPASKIVKAIKEGKYPDSALADLLGEDSKVNATDMAAFYDAYIDSAAADLDLADLADDSGDDSVDSEANGGDDTPTDDDSGNGDDDGDADIIDDDDSDDSDGSGDDSGNDDDSGNGDDVNNGDDGDDSGDGDSDGDVDVIDDSDDGDNGDSGDSDSGDDSDTDSISDDDSGDDNSGNGNGDTPVNDNSGGNGANVGGDGSDVNNGTGSDDDNDADKDAASVVISVGKKGMKIVTKGKIAAGKQIKLKDVASKLTDVGAVVDTSELFTGEDDNKEGKTFADIKAMVNGEQPETDKATVLTLDGNVDWKNADLSCTLNSTKTAYVVLANDVPVGLLRRENAHADNAKFFETDVFPNGFARQMREGKDVIRFGYAPFAVRVDTAAIAKTISDKQLADTAASLSSDYDQKIGVIKDSIITATVAANKGMWNGYGNPVKDSLIKKFTTLGVDNAAEIIDGIFADNAQAATEAMLTKAFEIAGKPAVARTEIKQMVDEAKYALTVQAPITQKLAKMGDLEPVKIPKTDTAKTHVNKDSSRSGWDWNKAF